MPKQANYREGKREKDGSENGGAEWGRRCADSTRAQGREIGVRYAAAEQGFDGGHRGQDAVNQEGRSTKISAP